MESSKQLITDDLDMARCAASGDPKARRQVMERVFDRIQKTLSYISNCKDEVDDLTQNALIEILGSLSSYRGEAPLEYWADRIATRSAAKTFAKRSKKNKLIAKVAEVFSPAAELPIEEVAEYRQILARFHSIFFKLSDEKRMVLVLHHIKGYSIDEIADISGCSYFAIKARLRRSRRLLKKETLRDPVLLEWVTQEFDRSKS